MAAQTAMPKKTGTTATPTQSTNGTPNGATPVRAKPRPVMYSDGLPSLRELGSEEVNRIYPPKMEPMPDGREHAINFIKIVPLLRYIIEYLKVKAFALGDIYIYYLDKYGQRQRVAPDAMVALDVSDEDFGEDQSYFVELIGKPPELVMEVASRSTYRVDLEAKPPIYAEIGISEYWMVDPFGGKYYGTPLRGLRLVDGEYEEIEIEELPDGALRGHSEVLGLDLYWIDGSFRIRQPSTGLWLDLPALADVRAREAAEARAEMADAAREMVEAEVARLREENRLLRERN